MNKSLVQNPKVLFFTTIMTWDGGACRALRETVKRVAAVGVKPLVVVPEDGDSREMFPESEFDVVYLKIQRPRRTWNPLVHARFLLLFPFTFLSLRRLIKQRGIQLVHFNELLDFTAGLAAASCRVPCVCHVRAHRLPNPYRWAFLNTLKATTDAVVVPSRYTAEWIKAESTELGKRVRLIYDYAWEDGGLKVPDSGPCFRCELGLTPGQILVVLVSRLLPLKGHDCFIRAAEKVLSTSDKVRFVIIGGPVEGREPEAAAIKALGEKLTPAPGLRFFGSRQNLGPVYSAADIVVHCPTYPDTYPTVVLLPMFAGKAIVGSDIGGIPEQIEHNKTGVLVPPNDHGALADAILELAEDPVKRESLGTAARKAIKERWAPETQGRLLAELYSEVIHCHSANGNGHSHSSSI
jgi:glycosyltransferase involved in cell wall biosynthesis